MPHLFVPLALALALGLGASVAHAQSSEAPEAARDAPGEIVEIEVEAVSLADHKRRSAEAVTVIETERGQRESAGLGELMARTQGVGVRQSGGLGSPARLSLNGLQDEQIRVFLDGVPLELAGHGFGFTSVPVDFLDEVEIYRGVVPVRLGADALGGAVNLIPNRTYDGTRARASYETGSFGSHRSTLRASHRSDAGLYAGASGFFDLARNDYAIDVEVADAQGRQSPARLEQFHDGYRAAGGRLELGVVGRPWARRLLLDVHAARHDKEIPGNWTMSLPYGEARHGRTSLGTNLRYEQPLAGGLTLALVAGYAHDRVDLVDRSASIYDWYGRVIGVRQEPGELGERPYDQITTTHTGFARGQLGYPLAPGHTLYLALAPTHARQAGEDRLNTPGTRDPLGAERTLTTLVTGLEYEAHALDDRLENRLFVKDYVYAARSVELLAGDLAVDRSRDTHRVGFGDAARLRLGRAFWLKASYEYATRLPDTGEVFGDGALVVANLELLPELSHNGNLGVAFDAHAPRLGRLRAELNFFARLPTQQIVALPTNRIFKYLNLYSARSLGVDGSLGWSSPGEHLALDANATFVDLRNTSSEGRFARYRGDRLPNRPGLFANASARLQLRGVNVAGDELALGWYTRHVQSFYRGWESVGLSGSKDVIPAQLTHSLGLTYLVRGRQTVTTSLELHNLTDARVFDSFGLERPGRAVFVKATVDY